MWYNCVSWCRDSGTLIAIWSTAPVDLQSANIIGHYFSTLQTTSRQLRYISDSLRWFSQRRSPTPHFWGAHTGGLWTQNSISAEIFVQCAYLQVSSSYVYSFESYRVDKQTNKQTNKQTLLPETFNVFRYVTTLGKHDQPSMTIHNVTRPLSKLDWRSTHSLWQTEQNFIFYSTKTLADPKGRGHGPQTTDNFLFCKKDFRTNWTTPQIVQM